MSRVRPLIAGLVWIALAATGIAAARLPQAQATSAQAQAQDPAGALDLLFDQGKRQFDAFQYDQAVPLFDRLIQAMTAGPEVQRPELLIQAYELRARARFALGDSTGAERDFSALLTLKPDFTLGAGVSPRVIAVFDNVRRLTIGQLTVQVTPPGDITIGGRRYTVGEAPLTVDLPGGEHLVNASRPNYTPFERAITVTPGGATAITITLERVSSPVSVVTTPDDVEVFLNDVSKGRTSGPSSTLVIPDVPLGTHRLRLTRACYVDVDMPLTVGPEDGQTVPVELTQAVATVTIRGAGPDATLVVDGQARGPLTGDVTVCAGPHVLEVRSPRGRHVERRDWKAGEAVTITAALRSAVPIVIATPAAGATSDQLRATIERVMAPASRVLIYAPAPSELEAALREENVPAGWLTVPGATVSPQTRDVARDVGRRLATRLGAQGVAAAIAGPEASQVTLLLLAAGSSEPDVLTFSLVDSGSQARAVERLNAPLPSLVRASLASSFIDVAGIAGAVVVRTTDTSGLVAGDVVIAAEGSPITSVAELRTALGALAPTAMALPADVRGAGNVVRQVPIPVTRVVDPLPLSEPTLLANRALFELQDASATATGIQKTAASIGLALIHLRKANWADALAALKDAQLPDGPGVSGGTIAYLNGVALEGLGRTTDARAAFTKAASQPQARLWFEGPLVAPLAAARLQDRR